MTFTEVNELNTMLHLAFVEVYKISFYNLEDCNFFYCTVILGEFFCVLSDFAKKTRSLVDETF